MLTRVHVVKAMVFIVVMYGLYLACGALCLCERSASGVCVMSAEQQVTPWRGWQVLLPPL